MQPAPKKRRRALRGVFALFASTALSRYHVNHVHTSIAYSLPAYPPQFTVARRQFQGELMPLYNTLRPLDRMPGDSPASHAALMDYYNMGAGRSLQDLLEKYRDRTESEVSLKPPTRRFATLRKWSADNHWQDRIAQQEQNERDEAARLRTAAMAAEAQKWAERRMAVREQDWSQAQKLRELAEDVLTAMPEYVKTSRVVSKDDGSVTVYKAIDAKLMVTAMETASKLQRLAAEMETEHTLSDTVVSESIDEVRKKRWEQIQSALGDALDDGSPQDA